MRKLVIALIVMALVSGAFAGEKLKSLELGARLGANFMYVITDSEVDPYPSDGALGGTLSFDVAYGLTSHLFIHSGIGLEYRLFMVFESVDETPLGCEENCDYKTVSEDFEYFMEWLVEMPLLLQWRVPGIAFFEAGALFDLLVDSKGHGPVKGTADWVEDLNNSFGVSLVAGIGHKFDIGLSIDFRALFQLTDLLEADGLGFLDIDGNFVPSGSYYKLLKFQLGFGYWF